QHDHYTIPNRCWVRPCRAGDQCLNLAPIRSTRQSFIGVDARRVDPVGESLFAPVLCRCVAKECAKAACQPRQRDATPAMLAAVNQMPVYIQQCDGTERAPAWEPAQKSTDLVATCIDRNSGQAALFAHVLFEGLQVC